MNKIPDISKQIYKEEVMNVLEYQYSKLGPYWSSAQLEWLNGSYKVFNNHDKFLIIIYLKKKTLDFYSRNFIKLTYDEFYSKDSFEVEKFSVTELSKQLNIPKESARRKLLELEKANIIKRHNKKCFVDRTAIPLSKPENSIKRISRFLNILSNVLKENKILSQSFKSNDIEKTLKKNFSYVWKLYYDFQIPLMLEWKNIFVDFETFHIWGICGVNDQANKKENKLTINRENFIKDMFNFDSKENIGINAMSISDISGIPRATVVRKLNKLVKKNYLKINSKKQYKLENTNLKKIIPVHKNMVNELSKFSQLIFNLLIANPKKK